MPSPCKPKAPLLWPLQGRKRRLLYACLFEGLGVLATALIFEGATGQSIQRTGLLALASSFTAFCWNLYFNYLFEKWEAKQTTRGRSVWRRLLHAAGFEAGLIALLTPLAAWWLSVSPWHALGLELGLTLYFLLYAYLFAWAFDLCFGLPEAAQ